MTPVKVTFALGNSIKTPEQLMHLDALVAWAAVEEAKENGAEDPLAAQENLPFAKTGDDKPVWKASALKWDEAKAFHHTETKTRRSDANEILRAASQPHIKSRPLKRALTSSGPLKQFIITENMLLTNEVYAYAITTDVDRLTELLSRIKGIGSTRNIGRGRVLNISVEVDSSAESNWEYRALPFPKEGYAQRLGAFTPPYWSVSDKAVVWEPC